MEQPMFYQGQRVVFLGVPKGMEINQNCGMPIEGKSYYVINPNAAISHGFIYITLQGFSSDDAFAQKAFIPYETDNQLEEEIHEALKGIKIYNP